MKAFSFEKVPADFVELVHDPLHIGHCPWSGCHVKLVFLVDNGEEWEKTTYEQWSKYEADGMVLVIGKGYSDPLGFDEDLFSRKMKRIGGNPELVLGRVYS
jgi:hypothetical protein